MPRRSCARARSSCGAIPRRIPDDLDTGRAIAFAYQGIGEYEVANGLFRDLVARGFALETDWT